MPATVTQVIGGGARSMVLSADESRLFVANSDGTISVVDIVTRSVVATWAVGNSLGGISISPDGSTLLVTETGALPSGTNGPLIYRVDTMSGAVQSFSPGTGSSFRYGDVEIVNDTQAIITSGAAEPTLFNYRTGTFGVVPASAYDANVSDLVRDGNLTLFGIRGSSDGPLLLHQEDVGRITARGDSYQTLPSPNVTGFNYGHHAVSERMGLVVQFIYFGSLNIYDENLRYLRSVSIGERVDGMRFSSTGEYLYIRLADSGQIARYDTTTWAKIDEVAVGATGWTNMTTYADQVINDTTDTIQIVRDTETGRVRIVDNSADNGIFLGTTGGDTLAGGTGSDRYRVDHEDDLVVELVSEGTDTVEASMDYVLRANVERLILVGNAISGTGNARPNDLIGNALDNTLAGRDGNDLIFGHGGDDFLFGDNGRDVIEGGTGSDQLYGGAANDSLMGGDGDDVLGGGAGGDLIVGGAGFDTLDFYVSGAGVTVNLLTGLGSGGDAMGDRYESIEAVIGSMHQDILTGSANSDYIRGGNANDTISGNAGDDALFGEIGDDILNGDGGSDKLDGWIGNDTVRGGADGDSLRGGDGDDVLDGGDGNDAFNGGIGVDIFTGGAGRDKFRFRDGETGNSIATADRITDLDLAQGERISLTLMDAIVGGADDAFAFIGTAAFGNVAGELRYEVIGGNTYVMGDTDGDGASDFMIRVDGAVVLTATDFSL